jgi:MFS family permease
VWKDLSASWAILLGIGCMMLANGLQGTLLGVRAGVEGFSTFTTGIMMSGYFVGIFIGSFLAPYLVRRVGHIRVFQHSLRLPPFRSYYTVSTFRHLAGA